MSDDSQARPGRIDCVLVAAGKFHDIDFARLELLKLLGEDERIRVRVFEDYSNLEAIRNAAFLVTDDNDGGERHVAATFNGLGYAVNMNQLLNQFIFLFSFVAVATICLYHHLIS